MQRVTTVLFSLLSSAAFSITALATDPGTYRPGQPYAASQAASHSQCQAQCQGDAACKGWNFVRANPRQKGGICEFNSQAVSPIQSNISISANQSPIVNPTGQSHVIQTGVRTTRIGAPQVATKAQTNAAQNQASNSRSPRTQPSVRPAPRRIVRQAVPNQIRPQIGIYRHSLGGTPQRLNQQPIAPQPFQQRKQAAPNQFTPNNPQLNPAAYRTPRTAGPQALQADPRLQQQGLGQNRPAAQRPQAHQNQQAAAPRPGSLLHALTAPNNQIAPAQRPAAQQKQRRPQPQETRRLSAEEAGQKSLYGHLNDDVTAPKILTQEDLNIPNDQAIPTVQSVPVKPVDRQNFSGLAGG